MHDATRLERARLEAGRIGAIGAVAYVTTLAAYLVASRDKNIAVNWTIVNLSVVVPIVLSVIWFGDAFTVSKFLGVVLTILSIVLISGPFSRGTAKVSAGSSWVFYISLAFLLNGVLVIIFRFVPQQEGALFTVYFYGISLLLVLPYKAAADRKWRFSRGIVVVSVGGAVTHWSGIMLTIAALAAVGRVSQQTGIIVYPITNGLVIPVGVVLGVLLLKQRVNRRTLIGVGVGVAALVCLFLP
jgi:drug/metabolite transporter (DMT)-like permease